MPPTIKTLAILAACSLPALILGCSHSGNFLENTSAAARDRIMYVRESPPTFGHFRLKALSSRYPDLATFISRNGTPEFLAETDKGDSHILILYYLGKRQQYACRSATGGSRNAEFIGPYPITDGEAKTLRNLRDGRPATNP